jgi:hypothetical protein
MNASAKQPVDFDFGDDLGATQPDHQADIRANAHVVNGGNVASFPCPNCRGSGAWRPGYSCFKCGGTGKISARKLGAIKAKATRAANVDAWHEEHADLIAALHRIAEWNNLAKSWLADLEAYGTLTENKIAAARTLLAKLAAKREEKQEERQRSHGGAVDIARIEELFDKARAKGLKRLAFRTEHITISVAKDTGKNPGALYVKHDGEYAGKIVGGVFKPFNAKPDTHALVCEIAENPAERAKQFGIKTGRCSCCGAELTDPVSIANGIGPICADNWGL